MNDIEDENNGDRMLGGVLIYLAAVMLVGILAMLWWARR